MYQDKIVELGLSAIENCITVTFIGISAFNGCCSTSISLMFKFSVTKHKCTCRRLVYM